MQLTVMRMGRCACAHVGPFVTRPNSSLGVITVDCPCLEKPHRAAHSSVSRPARLPTPSAAAVNFTRFTKASNSSKVSVQGRIHYSEYTDRDGNKRHATEIIADEVYFLDSAKKGEPTTSGIKSEPTMSEAAGTQEVPF